MDDWLETRVAFDRAAVEALEAHDMGPSYLMRLLTLVEWRWLRRDQAMVFGLPDYLRQDLVQVRATLSSYDSYYETDGDLVADSSWKEGYQRQTERARAKFDDLERRAQENVELSEATEALFEAHRYELDAFDPDGLQYWIKAVDDSLGWP